MIFFCPMSEHCSFPGLNASHRQCVAVICVSFPSDVQAFPAAFLLDPANAIDPGTGRVIPPWGSLNEEDTAAVKNLVRRMAPRGKQQAAVEELLQFISAGYANKDFARAAMVCFFSSHCSMSQVCCFA